MERSDDSRSRRVLYSGPRSYSGLEIAHDSRSRRIFYSSQEPRSHLWPAPRPVPPRHSLSRQYADGVSQNDMPPFDLGYVGRQYADGVSQDSLHYYRAVKNIVNFL